jgi:hypothetical protein
MPDQYAVVQPTPSRQPLKRVLKRATIAVLFVIVLMIPALRRLRRRFWIWTALRAIAVVAGGWLISRFLYADEGAGALVPGVLLVLFGLLVRARPQKKSVDSLADDLHALVVVNGGSFLSSENSKPVPHVRIFVNSERLLALAGLRSPLADIPFARVRELSAHPDSQPARAGSNGSTWSLEITWQSSELVTVRFHYEGAFAEHLARVAEKTLRVLWKKELPVLRA